MSDCSLLLGADLDLMSGPYETQVGSSFGAWSAVTAETATLFLDGSIVSGDASSNREIVLSVRVKAGDRYTLVEACEALVGEANKASNTLTFRAPGGPSIVYEVFRVGAPRRVDDESEAWLERTYELVFPALPFARSVGRESTGALAPVVSVDGFESSFAGARLVSRLDRGAMDWAVPVGSPATVPVLERTTPVAADFVAVSNGSVSTDTSHVLVTPSAGGVTVEVRSAASAAVSADVVTVAAKSTTQASQSGDVMVGVEWLDASDVLVRTDWGTPRDVRSNDPGSEHFDVWATAPRPVTASKARLRWRAQGVSSTEPYRVDAFLIVESATGGTVTVTANAAHDGAAGVVMSMGEDPSIDPPVQRAGYLYRTLPAPVDISGVAEVGLWVQPKFANLHLPTRTQDALSLRLYDSTGRWTRYWFRGDIIEAGAWGNLYAHQTNDAWQHSDAGAVDPTDVTAYDIDIRHDGSTIHLDTLVAADAVTATASPRGNIYELTPIIGSARSTARVELTSGQNLTDWLVAAVTNENGAPMLSIINGTASAAAPALYNGVYSVIGGQAPGGTALGTSCTVTQKIGGTTVATKTLTGIARTGGHYVDYGTVALPLVPVPADNQGVSVEFAFAAGSTGEALIIDVDASLAWVDNLTTAMPCAWVDEPDATSGLGRVWVGTQPDRSDARGLTNPPTLSRPLQVKAPSTRLLVYSTTTAPSVELSYHPRWLIEPTA